MEGYLYWKYKSAVNDEVVLKSRELLNGGVLNRKDHCTVNSRTNIAAGQHFSLEGVCIQLDTLLDFNAYTFY